MSKLSYLNVKNITETNAEVYFYGDIVGDEWEKWSDTDTCPQDVIDSLNDAQGKDLDIYINSCGGSVFAGLAIYNMLKRHKCKKTVHIDGLAASIASVIAMAGDEIIMPSNSFLMIHKPWNCVCGNADDMIKEAETLDTIEQGIVNVYKSKLKNEEDITKIQELMADETWLTADEAEKYFNVKIIEENQSVAKVDKKYIKDFEKVPQSIKNTLEKPAEPEKPSIEVKLDGEIKNKLNLLQTELELLSL